MGSKLRISTILESANTTDMLFYIRDHPRCRKSDIYRNVTRNAHTSERIMTLRDEGLLEIIQTARPNATLLALTCKGEDVVEHLWRIERLLTDEDTENRT